MDGNLGSIPRASCLKAVTAGGARNWALGVPLPAMLDGFHPTRSGNDNRVVGKATQARIEQAKRTVESTLSRAELLPGRAGALLGVVLWIHPQDQRAMTWVAGEGGWKR